MRDVGATVIVHRVHEYDMAPLVVSMPTDVLALSYPEGRRIPLHVGTGRAALAWLADTQIQAVLEKAGFSLLEEDGWRSRLADIRTAGVVVSYGEVTRGVTAVGSAVRRADGRPVAVVLVVAPEGACPEQHAGKVTRAAAVLSDLLSVPGSSPRAVSA
jgi:DNA-binding IclR family transcriptional regulator